MSDDTYEHHHDQMTADELREQVEFWKADAARQTKLLRAAERKLAEIAGEDWYKDGPTPSKLGEAMRVKERELRDDMDELIAKGAFHTTAVQKWLDGGCSSWGLPDQSIRYLLSSHLNRFK